MAASARPDDSLVAPVRNTIDRYAETAVSVPAARHIPAPADAPSLEPLTAVGILVVPADSFTAAVQHDAPASVSWCTTTGAVGPPHPGRAHGQLASDSGRRDVNAANATSAGSTAAPMRAGPYPPVPPRTRAKASGPIDVEPTLTAVTTPRIEPR